MDQEILRDIKFIRSTPNFDGDLRSKKDYKVNERSHASGFVRTQYANLRE